MLRAERLYLAWRARVIGHILHSVLISSLFTEPTWGRHKARTRPSVGNHEYRTPEASGYFDYFGSAAGDPKKGY